MSCSISGETREIGKAVQEKKNLGQTLFFGQSFSYTDTTIEQLFTHIWIPQTAMLDAKLLCFYCVSFLIPPAPLNPNTLVLVSSSDLL